MLSLFHDPARTSSRTPVTAVIKYLTQDEIYTVDEICIGGCSTEIMLKEIPNIYFNSVHFNVCNQ